MIKKELIAKLKKRRQLIDKVSALQVERNFIEDNLNNSLHTSGEPGVYVSWFRLENLLK